MAKKDFPYERTVILVKPDAVKRGLTGEIITRFEKTGFKIIAMKMVWVDREHAKKHYVADREEWVRNLGERTLKTYEEYGKDPIKELGTSEAMEIGKLVANWNLDFLTSGPVVAMLLEGVHAVKAARKLVGNTFPYLADPGTIRASYSTDSPVQANATKRVVRNVVHASGNPEEAKYEEELWFSKDEIHDYPRIDEEIMFG